MVEKKFAILMAFAFILTVIIFINSILAFSVSAPYMGEEKQIKLMPGQSRGLEFILQDAGAESDTEAGVQIQEGAEIIEITDNVNSYTIPEGGRVSIHAKITIPSDAQIGDAYNVILAFAGVAPGGGGFNFGTSIQQNFKVVVGKEEKPATPTPKETQPSNTLIYGIGILIIIIILLILAVIRKRNQ